MSGFSTYRIVTSNICLQLRLLMNKTGQTELVLVRFYPACYFAVRLYMCARGIVDVIYTPYCVKLWSFLKFTAPNPTRCYHLVVLRSHSCSLSFMFVLIIINRVGRPCQNLSAHVSLPIHVQMRTRKEARDE